MINIVYTLIVAFSLLNPVLATAHTTASANDFESFNIEDVQPAVYKVYIDSVSDDGTYLKVSDGLTFSINWWYQSTAKHWQKEEQLYISYDLTYQQFKIDNLIRNETAWSRELSEYPSSLPEIRMIQKGLQGASIVVLDDDRVFKVQDPLFQWHVGDRTLVLANSENIYQLWNWDVNSIAPFIYLGVIPQPIPNELEVPEVTCHCNSDETKVSETEMIEENPEQVQDDFSDDSV